MATTTQQTGSDAPAADAQTTESDVHAPAALENLALHATRLAMARWSSGNTCAEMQIAAAFKPTSQAKWYAQVEEGFRAWLEAGGFLAPAPDQSFATPYVRRLKRRR